MQRLLLQVDLQPDELIVSVRVPHPASLEFVLPFKQALHVTAM